MVWWGLRKAFFVVAGSVAALFWVYELLVAPLGVMSFGLGNSDLWSGLSKNLVCSAKLRFLLVSSPVFYFLATFLL